MTNVMKLIKYLDRLEDMTGKKVIVTGGTSGIGLAIVKHLLYKNATVIVMARNMEKADGVKQKLLEKYPDNPITIIQFDQGNKDSIDNAAQEIIKHHQDFYALVLNAGMIQSNKCVTYVNDIPQTIYTNFVGVSLFLDALIPSLKDEHRIILQGSLIAGLHMKKIRSLKDVKPKGLRQYMVSKCGVEALFNMYRLKEGPLSFYLVEPGVTNSEIIRDFPKVIRKIGHPFLKAVSHSPEKAALTALKALQSDTKSGSFIVPRGFLTCMGYPKYKRFTHHRERSYLVDLVNNI